LRKFHRRLSLRESCIDFRYFRGLKGDNPTNRHFPQQ
jgi:hypothetical protein